MNIRWVHEDALKFAQRLVKREEKFDVIIMDPPAWGIGAKKEKWKLEDKLDELLSSANHWIRVTLKLDVAHLINICHKGNTLRLHDQKMNSNES